MVWIHGGGYQLGSGSEPQYNGAELSARTDVIVVTINYRLNLFGFLYLNGNTNAPGNMGLLDQRMALTWIQRYIRISSYIIYFLI